jgi:predicted DNA-binding transcriptional regulator AlpA
MNPALPDDRLWTPRELAQFLGYTESTLVGLVSKHPERLPPRVAALHRPRWDPAAVRLWVTDQTVPMRLRGGRPRLS